MKWCQRENKAFDLAYISICDNVPSGLQPCQIQLINRDGQKLYLDSKASRNSQDMEMAICEMGMAII